MAVRVAWVSMPRDHSTHGVGVRHSRGGPSTSTGGPRGEEARMAYLGQFESIALAQDVGPTSLGAPVWREEMEGGGPVGAPPPGLTRGQ